MLIVVQASLKSGSLLTARLAKESGKKVFVIPGEIDDEQFSGNIRFIEKHRNDPLVEPLLNIERLREFLVDLRSAEKQSANVPEDMLKDLDAREKKVARLILEHPEGIDFDTLSMKSSLDPSALPSVLLSLSMMNLISETPGKNFQFTGDMK